MKKILLLVAPLLFSGYALPAMAADPATPPAAVLVRVIQLDAVGPDGKPHTLYRDAAGVLTSPRDLGRVTYMVKAGTLPEGGYHTLSVRLANEATAIYADGRQEPRPLETQGLTAEQRIGGMLWIEAGDVRALRTRPHAVLGHGHVEGDD